MIFDKSGAVIAIAQKEHQQFTPHPGWVEHDAGEIWQNTQSVIKEAISAAEKKAGLDSIEISAIGITNQRETIVAWDAQTGKALHHAIVWQDTRTADFLDGLSQSDKELLTSRTGLAIAPYFSASKINWLLNNVEPVKQALAAGNLRIGTIDSWLTWNLSGGLHITDVTNASRTMLMDLRTLEWDAGMLELFGIPPEILPRIVPSSALIGEAELEGHRVPIAGIAGDQQAAAGLRVTQKGLVHRVKTSWQFNLPAITGPVAARGAGDHALAGQLAHTSQQRHTGPVNVHRAARASRHLQGVAGQAEAGDVSHCGNAFYGAQFSANTIHFHHAFNREPAVFWAQLALFFCRGQNAHTNGLGQKELVAGLCRAVLF